MKDTFRIRQKIIRPSKDHGLNTSLSCVPLKVCVESPLCEADHSVHLQSTVPQKGTLPSIWGGLNLVINRYYDKWDLLNPGFHMNMEQSVQKKAVFEHHI